MRVLVEDYYGKPWKIGELAKMFDINVQLLRHYDKEGLLVPEIRNPDNKWRAYNYDQIYSLGMIRLLRDLDCPLDDIGQFMRDRSLESSKEFLHLQLEEARARYNRLLSIEQILRQRLAYIEDELRYADADQIFVYASEEIRYIEVGGLKDDFADECFYLYPTVVFYTGDVKRFAALIPESEGDGHGVGVTAYASGTGEGKATLPQYEAAGGGKISETRLEAAGGCHVTAYASGTGEGKATLPQYEAAGGCKISETRLEAAGGGHVTDAETSKSAAAPAEGIGPEAEIRTEIIDGKRVNLSGRKARETALELEKRIKTIPPDDYLVGFHHGSYDSIYSTFKRMRESAAGLLSEGESLDDVNMCIDIINQFIEADPENFVTRVMIRIIREA